MVCGYINASDVFAVCVYDDNYLITTRCIMRCYRYRVTNFENCCGRWRACLIQCPFYHHSCHVWGGEGGWIIHGIFFLYFYLIYPTHHHHLEMIHTSLKKSSEGRSTLKYPSFRPSPWCILSIWRFIVVSLFVIILRLHPTTTGWEGWSRANLWGTDFEGLRVHSYAPNPFIRLF